MRLQDLTGDVDLIVSSPYTRARQTAEILSQIYYEIKVVEASELAPHCPPHAFARWLQAHGRDHKSVIVVGHEPQMTLFASYLIAGADESILELKKSGAALIELDATEPIGAASGILRWLIPPKVLSDE